MPRCHRVLRSSHVSAAVALDPPEGSRGAAHPHPWRSAFEPSNLCVATQVVPVVPQGGNDVNAYISLCLGVTLSFSAAMSLVLLWRWAHQRGQEGLPTLAPGRTTTGIEPATVASFPTYRYQVCC